MSLLFLSLGHLRLQVSSLPSATIGSVCTSGSNTSGMARVIMYRLFLIKKVGDEWGGWRRLSLRSSARRGRPSRTGCLPPPRQQLGLCASGVDLCGAVDCPWTPDAGLGRAFHLLGLERPPPLPSPCAYSKRTRGPDHTSPRGSESTNDPRALARRLLPRLQQRSVRRSLRRSPRRAAHAAAYEGPYAALPVVMGVPLLLPSCAPSHLPATCAPVAAADVNTATHAGF